MLLFEKNKIVIDLSYLSIHLNDIYFKKWNYATVMWPAGGSRWNLSFWNKRIWTKIFFFCSVSALYLFLFFYSCVLIVFLFRISSAWDLVLCLVERFYHIGELSHGLKNVPSSVILVFLNFFFGSHQFGTRVLLKDFITLEDYLTKKKIENVPSLVIFSYQFAT